MNALTNWLIAGLKNALKRFENIMNTIRQIILDTETTGLDPRQGHRIIEVAALELVNRRPTGRHVHEYIHPDRDIEADAQRVHGISLEFLADKPRFADIAPALIEFISGAELVIHNAAFDTGFLDAEFARLDQPNVKTLCPSVLDTLKMARELHPGKRNNLDALCERYAIDNTQRSFHGALLDAQLLADVYLAMTRGQNSLIMEDDSASLPAGRVQTALASGQNEYTERKSLKVLKANEAELAAHQAVLNGMSKGGKGACLWLPTLENALANETTA